MRMAGLKPLQLINVHVVQLNRLYLKCGKLPRTIKYPIPEKGLSTNDKSFFCLYRLKIKKGVKKNAT